MIALAVVIFIILYLVLGIVIIGLGARLFNEEVDEDTYGAAIGCVLFWPFVLILCGFGLMAFGVGVAVEWLAKPRKRVVRPEEPYKK